MKFKDFIIVHTVESLNLSLHYCVLALFRGFQGLIMGLDLYNTRFFEFVEMSIILLVGNY